METPDIPSAFEGVPLVGDESSVCVEEPLQEQSTNRATYEKWERIAKCCMLVFGCLYLATLYFLFVAKSTEQELDETVVVISNSVTYKRLIPYKAAVWEDGLTEREMVSFDDDVTIWEGVEEQGQTEKPVEWQDEVFVLAAPVVSDEAVFQQYLKEKRNTFVAFNAPWCIWSQQMRRAWHEFAAVWSNSVDGNALQVVEVNCGLAPSLCKNESVLAFPTMRWYRNGERFSQDEYMGGRTINEFLEYSEDMIHRENASSFGYVPRETARSIVYSDSEDIYSDSEDETRSSEDESSEVNTEWAGVPEEWLFATSLTRETFEEFITTNKNAFVAFTAPWCVRCERVRPSWHQFALVAQHAPLDVGVAEVDCTAQADLCRDLKIMAFPTMRWFRNSQPVAPDYELDRTVTAFLSYSRAMLPQVQLHEEQVPNKLNTFIGDGELDEENDKEEDKEEPDQAKEQVGFEGQSTSISSEEDEAEDQEQATDSTGNVEDALSPRDKNFVA